MVTARRQAVSTVAFIDNYCQHYYSTFEDVRHFEAFKKNHYLILLGFKYALLIIKMSDLLNKKLDLYRSNYEAFISKYGEENFYKFLLWLRDHASEAAQLCYFTQIGGNYPKGIDRQIFEKLLTSNLKSESILPSISEFLENSPEKSLNLIKIYMRNRGTVGDRVILNQIDSVLKTSDLEPIIAQILERFTSFLNKYHGDVLGGVGLLYNAPIDMTKFIPVSHGYFA